MADFVSDSFTDTAGTVLSSHTGETGATWTQHPSYAVGTVNVSSAGLARENSASVGLYYASGTPAGAEYDVSASLKCVSNAGSMGVVGRVDTAADSNYFARFANASGWQLFRYLSGAATTLGTDSVTNGTALTVGTSYSLTLRITDAAKKLIVNGVELISSANNAVTAAGRAGIRGQSGTDATSYHLDNFLASDAGGSTAVTGSDSGTGSAGSSLAAAIAGADSGTATEAGSLVVILAGSDAGSGTEAAALVVTLAGSDSGTETDAGGVNGSASLAGADSGTWTDAAALVVTLAGSDSGTATDARSLAASLAGSDAGSGTDSGALAAAIAAAELGTATDASAVLIVGAVDTGSGPSWFILFAAEGLDLSGPVLAEDLAGAEPSGLDPAPVLAEDL